MNDGTLTRTLVKNSIRRLAEIGQSCASYSEQVLEGKRMLVISWRIKQNKQKFIYLYINLKKRPQSYVKNGFPLVKYNLGSIYRIELHDGYSANAVKVKDMDLNFIKPLLIEDTKKYNSIYCRGIVIS